MDILIVLMLSQKLLPQIDLLSKESLLILSIGVIMIPVNTIAPERNVLPSSVLSPNSETLFYPLKSFLPKLHLSFDLPSLSSDHALLIFLCHVFFVGDALVKLVP